MTRDELIGAIYDSKKAWSCPSPHTCDLPEEEGNSGDCCMKCAERQLAEYEAKIRAYAIDEFVDALIKPSNYERFDFDEMLTDSNKTNDFFKYVFAIAEQLKEQK